MSRRKLLLWIYLLALPVVLVMALLLGVLLTGSATAHALECQTCHSQKVTVMSEGIFVKDQYVTDDQGPGVHFRGPSYTDHHLILQLDQEVCFSCHQDQYNAFKVLASVKTFYEASDDRLVPLEGWKMTSDLPNWNALIDERLLVLESDD